MRGGIWRRLDRHGAERTAAAGRAAPLPDASRAKGTLLIPQLRHIVVLMMENHSYDNYLGMLDRGDGLPRDAAGVPTSENSGVRAHHLDSTTQYANVPSQSWSASHEQFDNGACDGFVTSAKAADPAHPERADVAMGYWDESDIPFYQGLARTFTVADRWFCSCLGPTFPNRRFLIAGTASGLTDDNPLHLLDRPDAGTIFDLLTASGVSWANYYPGSRSAAAAKRLLGLPVWRFARRLVLALGRLVPPLLDLAAGKVQFTADLYPLGLAGVVTHLRSLDDFFADAAAGTLPAFSIVDPDFDVFSEENPQDIQVGESFAADVVAAVMRGKGWPQTLLLWCYDEHGGYYDHVPPPAAVPPDGVLSGAVRPDAPSAGAPAPAPASGAPRFDRLGFRVPAVVVSPYARTGAVDSTVYDHTSVLRLLQATWNLPPLTARDAEAKVPLAALDLDSPPALLDPPALPAPALGPGAWRRPRPAS